MASKVPGPRSTHYDRLGGGIVRPFVWTFHSDFASDQGTPLVMSNLGQIAGTRRGTLPWRPSFGSSLVHLLHQANTPVLREKARIFLSDAFTKWEPRVALASLTVDAPARGQESQIKLHASVSIEGTSELQRLDSLLGRGSTEGEAPPALFNYALSDGRRVTRGPLAIQLASGPTPALSQPQLMTFPPGGLLRPVDRGRDFRRGQGPSVILSNVGQVLGTEERTLPWRPRFGSKLPRLRHRSNTPVLKELAAQYVREALGAWETRATASGVNVIKGTDPNLVSLQVTFDVAVPAIGDVYQFSVAVK